jgi:hypothetical protein
MYFRSVAAYCAGEPSGISARLTPTVGRIVRTAINEIVAIDM